MSVEIKRSKKDISAVFTCVKNKLALVLRIVRKFIMSAVPQYLVWMVKIS